MYKNVKINIEHSMYIYMINQQIFASERNKNCKITYTITYLGKC